MGDIVGYLVGTVLGRWLGHTEGISVSARLLEGAHDGRIDLTVGKHDGPLVGFAVGFLSTLGQ